MIVIVEGPRASGKTTLCKKLVEQFIADGFKAEYKKFSRGSGPTTEMLLQLDAMATKSASMFYVVDRFHLTEYVMSRLYTRAAVGPLSKGIDVIVQKIQDVKAFVIAIRPSEEIRQSRLSKRRDGRGDETEDLAVLRVLWGIALRSWPADYVVGDEADEDVDGTVLLLARYIEGVSNGTKDRVSRVGTGTSG